MNQFEQARPPVNVSPTEIILMCPMCGTAWSVERPLKKAAEAACPMCWLKDKTVQRGLIVSYEVWFKRAKPPTPVRMIVKFPNSEMWAEVSRPNIRLRSSMTVVLDSGAKIMIDSQTIKVVPFFSPLR